LRFGTGSDKRPEPVNVLYRLQPQYRIYKRCPHDGADYRIHELSRLGSYLVAPHGILGNALDG
jgi:hypothetical protein